ncbi:MAG: hypothetical protein PHD95_06900 [Candidatus ainarchaeum sp.]|nr:hypothetical protein [Candidatus ainarchaeum sp.]
MGTKKAVLILVALVVLAGIAWFVAQASAPPTVESIEQPDFVDPSVLEGTSLPDNTQVASEPALSSDCEKILNPDRRNYCFFALADNAGTVESCTKITDIAARNNCVKTLAVDKSNTSFCNYSVSAFNPNDNSNVKYECISAVAEDKADEKICNEIPETGWKNKCLETVASALSPA